MRHIPKDCLEISKVLSGYKMTRQGLLFGLIYNQDGLDHVTRYEWIHTETKGSTLNIYFKVNEDKGHRFLIINSESSNKDDTKDLLKHMMNGVLPVTRRQK